MELPVRNPGCTVDIYRKDIHRYIIVAIIWCQGMVPTVSLPDDGSSNRSCPYVPNRVGRAMQATKRSLGAYTIAVLLEPQYRAGHC